MIFLANIGNTNLIYGLYDPHGRRIAPTGHCPISRLADESEALQFFRRALRQARVAPCRIGGVVLSSVVPPRTPVIENAARDLFHLEPVVLGSRESWEFDTSAYSGLVGTDRLLCCSAALKKYRPPLLVVDLGTATTLNVLDARGAFAGGVIAPGVRTGLHALAVQTAQLPEVPLFGLKSAIGKNTEQCMLSGATFGTAFLLEGFRGRIQRELGAAVTVVVTGGNAKQVLPFVGFEFHYEPDLLLEGLALRADRIPFRQKEASFETE